MLGRIQKNTSTLIPLNTASTVRKYEPIGTRIMARVKARSFMMTDLRGDL
jgi:hypothetical protein